MTFPDAVFLRAQLLAFEFSATRAYAAVARVAIVRTPDEFEVTVATVDGFEQRSLVRADGHVLVDVIIDPDGRTV